MLWSRGRRGRPRIRGNLPAARAETILLVGSEGGSTWGFAATLHRALTEAGQSVHAAPMSAFDPDRYARARADHRPCRDLWRWRRARIGEGVSRSARQARPRAGRPARRARLRRPQLSRLLRLARKVARDGARQRAGRCSCPSTRWTASRRRISPAGGARSGDALGIELELAHQPVLPATEALTLISRRDYGARGPGADRDPALRPPARLALAAPDRPGLRALPGGRSSGHPARGLARAALLFARLGAPRRLRRDRREEAPRRPLLRPAHGARAGRQTVRAFLRRNPGFRPGRGRARR